VQRRVALCFEAHDTLVLRVVAEVSRRIADRGLSPDDVVAVLAGNSNAFEPARIASVLAELRQEQFVADDGAGLRLTELGKVVASSGLAVRSAARVAGVFRRLQPQQLCVRGRRTMTACSATR